MEAEQHLARRAAMSKDQRRTFACLISGNKELAMDRESIAALEGDLLWHHQLS